MKYLLTVDFPPSVNTYYTVFRGRKIISSKGQKYKKQVANQIKKELGTRPKKLTGRLRLYLGFSYFQDREYDISNFIKCIEDCISGVLFVDDSQIDEVRLQRLPVSEEGYCRILVEQIPKEEQLNGLRKKREKRPTAKQLADSIYDRLMKSGRRK